MTQTKEERAAYFREWRRRNRSKCLSYDRNRRKGKNRIKYNRALREARKQNPAKARKKQKEYYRKNRKALLARIAHYRQISDTYKQYHRAYYHKNREAIRQKQTAFRKTKKYAAWHKKNCARLYAVSQKRRKKLGPLAWNLYMKQWRDANREEVRRQDRARRLKNLEKAKVRERCSASKRRARKRGATLAQLRSVKRFYEKSTSRKNATCHWCKAAVPQNRRHIDHRIPLARGGSHSTSNLVIACSTCNLSKGAKLPAEYRRIVRLLQRLKSTAKVARRITAPG